MAGYVSPAHVYVYVFDRRSYGYARARVSIKINVSRSCSKQKERSWYWIVQLTARDLLKMFQRSQSNEQRPRVRVSIGRISLAFLLCTAITAGFLLERTAGLPLRAPTQHLEGDRGHEERSIQRRMDGVDENANYRDYYYDFDNETFDPLPPVFRDPTPEPPPAGCFIVEEVTRRYWDYHVDENGKRVRELRNYTETVRSCCKNFTGFECNQRVQKQAQNCSNLVCEGNADAFCAIITKCGRTLPLFIMPDGDQAKCDNGQPSDITTISCTTICSVNPCAGLTCPIFPDAMCLYSSCDCKPLWLLPEGIHVDCAKGKHLTPEESRRRRRQTDEAENYSSNCT